ncbi:MAG: response regulator [Acaryochloris sp. CRU_2_0]|nr:response regulator [Acaryochloris sp. CRU_2_0]
MLHNSKPSAQDHPFPLVRKSRILVIDDSLLLRKQLSAQLPSDRFEVYEAENGSAGLAKAAETNPDLILLDYVMPGMDGYEVYQSLRAQEQFRNTPIIVMSGRHDEVVEKFGPLFDNYNFWLKQASQDQLRDRINAVLPMTVSGSETENTQTSVNVEVQDIAAFMSHLGQLENQLTEKMVNAIP